MKKKVKFERNALFTVMITALMLFSFAQPVHSQDRLKSALEKCKQQKVFLNWEDNGLKSSSIAQKLKEDEALVIYASAIPSSGYQWVVEGNDEGILKLEKMPESDAFEISPAPGALVNQRIVLTGLAKGETEITLKYCRPWLQQRGVINSVKIKVASAGEYKGKFSFVPSKSNVKKLTPEQYQVKAVPSNFDWRDQGVETPVKDQGQCGSCWAFGATAGFESKIKKKDGVVRDLAEQYLVSCNEWGMSCAGGGWWAHDLWMNTIPPGETGAGAVYESAYPYQAQDLDCNGPNQHYEQLEGWAYVDDVEDNRWPTMDHSPTTAQIKQKLYDWGPIPTALCTDNWGSYTSGVLGGSSCTTTSHIVCIVGWNDSQQCWIIKNSWGADWGENGYVRIAYGSHLVGDCSTYLKYDKTNPRIIYSGTSYWEGLNNDGSIRAPIQMKLFNVSFVSSNFTQGTHYTISGLPSGLSGTVNRLSSTSAEVVLSGKASQHLEANSTNFTVNFLNAAFSGVSASGVENSSSSLEIKFMNPYKIVYEDIPDQTCAAGGWESFTLKNGYSFGLWHSYYEYEDQAGTATFFLETYGRKALCTTSGSDVANDRKLKVLNQGATINGSSSYWVIGGSYGEQHKIACAAYQSWYGKTAYVGFSMSMYGANVYGWFRLKVNSSGSSVTILDYAYNEQPGATMYAGEVGNTDTQPPSVPTNLKTDSYTSTSISISWTASTDNVGVTGYDIFSSGSLIGSSTTNSYTATGLKCYQAYGFTVRAKDATGNFSPISAGLSTATGSCSTDTQAPSTPTNLAAGTKTSTSIALSWTASTDNVGVTGYDVYRSSTLVGTATGTSYTATGLTANTTYSFYVKAKDAAGNVSAASNTVSATTTGTTDDGGPLSNGVTANGNMDSSDGSDIWYIDVAANATSMRVVLECGSADFDTYGKFNAQPTTSSYDWRGYTSGGEDNTVNNPAQGRHYIMVDYYSGSGSYTLTATVTYGSSNDTQAPSAPTNLAAGTTTATSVALSWTASTDNVGVTGYDVYRSSTLVGSSTGTSYTVTGLTCNTSYSFTVRAKDAAGNVSAASNTATKTTSACGDTQSPSTPTNLAAGTKTSSSIALSWTASTDNVGVTGYDVYRNSSNIGTATGTSYTATGLSPSTTYSFNVRAKDAAGNVSAASNTISATTLGGTVTYCAAKSTSTAYEYFSRVVFGSINQSSASSGYADYTSVSTNLVKGSPTSISMTTVGNYSTDELVVYIDYNRDGDFTDSGEEVYFTDNAGTAKTYTASITAPSGASTGSTRMRIVLYDIQYNSKSSCGDFNYGEVEDYTINIVPGSPGNGLTADGVVVSPNPCSDVLNITLPEAGATIRLTAMSGKVVYKGTAGATNNTIDVSAIPAGIYNLSIITGDAVVNKRIVIK